MSIIYNAYNIDINITHNNITLINIYVFIYNPPLRSYCKNVRIYCKNVRIYCNYSTVKMYTIVITVKMYVLYCKRRSWMRKVTDRLKPGHLPGFLILDGVCATRWVYEITYFVFSMKLTHESFWVGP